MTRLTDIAKHVTEPDPADLLYIVDVSDLSDGPSGSSGFTTPADLLRNTPLCYATRAEAEAAQVPAGAAHIFVGTLAYREDPAGTALTTADGRNWSPDGRVTYEHWGAVGDGVTDDSDAIIACHRWCLFNRATCEPIGATYAVTKRILTYDVAADGPGLEFHLRGAGKGQTVFRIAGHISDSLFYITGDTSAPNRSRAINWSFSDFQVVSDGLVDADVFRIDIATSIEFHDVGIYNCRGTALRARELWDSQIEISVVECGDDGTGTGPGTRNKYAIEIDNYFGSSAPDLGSNNLDFTPRFQVEASRYIQVYLGRYTKQVMFSGKFHGRLNGTLALPHVLMDGAYRNMFYGCVFTVCADVCIRTTDASGTVPFNNSFIGNHFDSTGPACIELNAAQRNVVVGNVMINATAGVHLVSGSNGNVIHSNVIMNGGEEYRIDTLTAMDPLQVPRSIEITGKGSSLVLTDANGTPRTLTVGTDGRLRVDGIPV